MAVIVAAHVDDEYKRERMNANTVIFMLSVGFRLTSTQENGLMVYTDMYELPFISFVRENP